MFKWFIRKVFGTQNERDLKRLLPLRISLLKMFRPL